MKSENLFFATIVWSPASTTPAARIVTAPHRNDADDVAEIEPTKPLGVGAKPDNPAAGFMADRSWTLNPREIWFAGTGTVVRSADAHEHRFDDDLAFLRFRQRHVFDGEISSHRAVWFRRVDVLGSVQSQRFDRLAQDSLRLILQIVGFDFSRMASRPRGLPRCLPLSKKRGLLNNRGRF